MPIERVDRVEEVRPVLCQECGARLAGSDRSPERRQVTEIPPLRPTVTEYRLHAICCGRCGATTRAPLPDGVPERAFGLRLQSLLALLAGAYRISKRGIEDLCHDVFNVEISLGSIANLEDDTSRVLEEPVEEAKRFVREQGAAHLDETGWRQENRRAWLWTAVTSAVTIFLIRLSRGSDVAKEILGETFKGFLVSDRWSGYSWVDLRRRQLCWAHLIRDFRKIAEFGGTAAPIGEALLACAKELFRSWHRVRDGTLKRSSFRVYASRVRVKVRGLLADGAASAHPKSASMCRAILRVEPALWTFVRVEGLEPTNNDAERAIRPVVLWRKGSFGTQSRGGSDFVERILTTVATLRQQRRNVLEYLTSACEAALHGRPAPSLIPVTSRARARQTVQGRAIA